MSVSGHRHEFEPQVLQLLIQQQAQLLEFLLIVFLLIVFLCGLPEA
jgi:hypothetical protein